MSYGSHQVTARLTHWMTAFPALWEIVALDGDPGPVELLLCAAVGVEAGV